MPMHRAFGSAAAFAVAALLAMPAHAAGSTALPTIDEASTFGRCVTAELAADNGTLVPEKAAVRIVLTCTGASHCPDGSCRSIDIDLAARDVESWVLALRENTETREDCAKQVASGQPAVGVCQVVNHIQP
jgi:hypothetical protein